MDDEKRQFQIYLPGLLKVLAESLYSTKKVAIRELIQNAHDSCVRRSVEDKEHPFRPRVDITTDQARRVLIIEDNGSGLTAEDVVNYLSTIGRSYTRELGENLSILSPEEANKLIGQFGLGFLSAFLVASDITLTTKSFKEGSPTLQWRSNGDIHYQLTPVEGDRVGTRVELEIKPTASFVFSEGVLVDTVQQYADFLNIPIYVNGSRYPVNTLTPPWEALDKEAATQDYIARAFNMTAPLAVIHLHDQEVDLGHDTMAIPMQGFLFVPPTSVASVREYGDLTVYIKRMFICEQQRDLLPPWARFVRGVIDCPYLQPTASREEIQQDDTFLFVQQALESQLTAGLKQIAEQDPVTWKKIVVGHSDVITGWAVQDNAFFAQVADIVTFRTSRGQLSLSEYLRLTDDTIYYTARELGSLQEQLLGEGHGVPVIDASWFAVAPFLRKYADYKKGTRLVQLDGESNQLLRPAPDEPFAPLLDFYRQANIRARVATFRPEEIPAIMMYPKDAEFLAETRNALDSGELQGPLAGLIGDYMRKMSTDGESLDGTLYLNAGCALTQQLAKIENAEARGAALTLIFQMARLFSGRMLDSAKVAQLFRESSGAIEKLIVK
jgi:molecular chaperone HtpG